MNRMLLEQFYKGCEDNRELLRQICVMVPVRPHDGIALDLEEKLKLWFKEGIYSESMPDSNGGFIQQTRAKMARRFRLETEYKYLLMIDNDTEPPLELPLLLARHDMPVVGSCVSTFSLSGRHMLCFSRADKSGHVRFVDFQDGDRIPATGLVEVYHVGCGATMIRRDVFDAFSWEGKDIPFMVPDEMEMPAAALGKVARGEDIWFCQQLRDKGIKIHVDLAAHCGHRKTMRLTFPPDLRDPSLKPENWFASERGQALSM